MNANLTPEFGELETYRGFTILGRILDLQADTQWRVELKIGLQEEAGFVEKVPAITREVFKGQGALNLAQAALVDARAAIDDFIEH